MPSPRPVKKSAVKEYSQSSFPESDGFEGGVHPRLTFTPLGCDAIIEQFCTAYREGKSAKAYLFLGAKGSGKATLAYALIRGIIRAETEKRDLTPEDVLSTAQDLAYRQIAALSYPNIKTLRREYQPDTEKFQSSIPLDTARKLKDFFHLKPHGRGARFCVIDSAEDMLKNNAAVGNALLKTIEEPPANSYFFIIAHSAGAAPVTVRSRCETVRFSRLSDENLQKIMQNSPSFSGVTATEAPDILQAAQGSVRTAAIYADKRKLRYAATLKDLLCNGGEAQSAFDRIYVKNMLAEKDFTETARAIRAVTLAVTAECAKESVMSAGADPYPPYRLSALFFQFRNLFLDAENYNFLASDLYEALCNAVNRYIYERKARVFGG